MIDSKLSSNLDCNTPEAGGRAVYRPPHPIRMKSVKMKQTYCVFNATLLPHQVAELQLQRSVSAHSEYAESFYSARNNSEAGLKSAVHRLILQAQEKGIQHPFSSDQIMHLLGRLIETRDTPTAEYRLRIYAADRPVLFIC